MKNILTWLAVLALVTLTLSAELPILKKNVRGIEDGGDLKTASSFIGPFGWGGWSYPYFGYGWGWGGWGYPYWG